MISKIKLGANRTEVLYSNGVRLLISYATPVAAVIPGVGAVKTEKRYSVTTSKHIGQWFPQGARSITEVTQAYLDEIAATQGARAES